MDQKELNEGMPWKELDLVLKDKVEVDAKEKVEVDVEVKLPSLCDKNGALTWVYLLVLLIKERSFFSLRKDLKGKASILKEATSRRVLDYFFERGWETPISKSRNG
jgi:hypothetical protein